MANKILKGITWGHSRGLTPLLAAAQRFNELYPDVEIKWSKRSLQEFADYPIEKLTETYDLLIIDHPWVGCAAETNCVLPLDAYLGKEYLADQLANSVGQSHISYQYKGHQWALAIDAATPVSSYRADLFRQHQVSVPANWSDVLELAKEGKVAVPAIAIDILMNFYAFCIAHGTAPFTNRDEVIDVQTGVAALQSMRELYSLVNKELFQFNPIKVAEAMTKGDDYWYCPFSYGYSNYARVGYAAHQLTYTDLPLFGSKKLVSTIGGTGLSVSAYSQHQAEALKFTEMVVAPAFQSTFYVEHGGQPGHLAAWVNEAANRLTNNYFNSTLPAMQRGYMRPRYHGYLHFQDEAGEPIRRYLMHGGNPESILKDINQMYKRSLAVEHNFQA